MSADQPIDVRDMHIVHATFRTAYTQSAQLVRADPTPSPQRVAFLADHIEFGLSMLHHHHESEDELLYPVLVARAPEQAARTEQIDEEHRAIATAIDESLSRCATWRTTPSAETGEALAASLDALLVVLEPHLADEEAEVVPLAFGMMLEPLDEADRAHMRHMLPLPVRTLLYKPLIQRPWDRYKEQLLHGT